MVGGREGGGKRGRQKRRGTDSNWKKKKLTILN